MTVIRSSDTTGRYLLDTHREPFDGEHDDHSTVVVPERRPGVFAVILVDGREALLRVARWAPDGSFQTLREERETFLGDAGNPRERHQATIKLADILIRFQRAAELWGAAIRALATQEFRAVPNHLHLLQRLPRITRVAVEMISDREMARLVCLGVLAGRRPGHRSLVIELGTNSTSIILASADQPLALWRLPIGTGQFGPAAAGAPGNPRRDSERKRLTAWRRQIQQTLSLGHLHAIRGTAREAVLIRPREWILTEATASGTPANAVYVAGVALLDEIAAYLKLTSVQSTEGGLHQGVLLDLARSPLLTTGAAAASARGHRLPPRSAR